MKKYFLISILSATICTSGFSQTEDDKQAGFHLGFIYPLSTNGIHASEYTNGVSFHILAGISQNEKAFAFGGMANIIRRDAGGLQMAGLYNSIGNNGKGFLWSGLVSLVGNDYTGLQLSGTTGFVGKNHVGLQLSGLMSYAGNSLSGMQIAGLANVAGEVKGMQWAGLVNIAKEVKGVQFAGLLNIADNSDYPIGLVNLIKNGEKGIAVTYSETGSIIASFRSGGRVTYGILGVGYNHKAGRNAFVTEAGLGAHINCTPRFRINNEIRIENFVLSKNTVVKTGYHLLASYRILPHMEIFAGPSLNYMSSDDMHHTDMFPHNALWKKHDASNLQQIFVGYQTGVQYVF
jgi:hypothetical protein